MAAELGAIGQFTVTRVLNEGGMGTVYLCRDPKLQRGVAVKLIKASLEASSEGTDYRVRFEREARLTAKLEHPNIVKVFHTDQHEGRPYIVMQYVDGLSLQQQIQSGTEFSLATKLGWIEMLCDGLDHAHQKRIIHRDVKPANVMVDSTGVVRILDFGLARELDETGLSAIVGTVEYSPPELALGKADARTDVFGVGAVLFEVITRQPAHPFSGAAFDAAIVAMDADVRAIVACALQAEPADRYQSISELRAALQAVLATREGNEDVRLTRPARRRSRLEPKAPRPQEYLDWLQSQCASVELLGLRLKQGQSVTLSNVYIPLVTTHPAPPELVRRGDSKRKIAAFLHRDKVSLILNRLCNESIYVSGDAGTGKSTFCRWATWLAAEGAMPPLQSDGPEEFREQFAPALAGRLPLLVYLREFRDRLPDRSYSGLTPPECQNLLAAWLEERWGHGLDRSNVIAHLEQGSALLILDGIDEVPPGKRELLLSCLGALRADWVNAGNRLLVTSRPYGLDEPELRLLGLPVALIAPLPDPLQELLVRRWFSILDAVAGTTNTADKMLRQVGEQPWLAPLTANPLLLTAMCIVFGEGKGLPEDKYELYDRVVDNVLHSRISEAPRRKNVRSSLSVVAHGMHAGEGLDMNPEVPFQQVKNTEIDRMLRKFKSQSGYGEQEIRTVAQDRDELIGQTGILLPKSDGEAGFFHLSFQEFLAAQRVADVDYERIHEVFVERSRRPEWRNTLSFLFGTLLAQSSTPERATRALQRFFPAGETAPPGLLLVAADCVEILNRRRLALPDLEARLGEQLARAMREGEGAVLRCSAGTALGRLGDHRFLPDRWFLPNGALLGFIDIPAGSFTMGSDKRKDNQAFDDELKQHPVDLRRYLIGRWPVTVAQFALFATDAAREGFAPEDAGSLNGVPNHPVTRVTWHEALRYCAWLTAKLRESPDTPEPLATLLRVGDGAGPWRVTLPSEAEWEKAARGPGTASAIYPWGDAADPNKANYGDTGINTTSAVGCFPEGRSLHYGVEDLSGNVREWTRSVWVENYPYHPDYEGKSREDSKAGNDVPRVVRGGAFYSNSWYVRSAYRNWNEPDFRNNFLGFRVVVSPFASDL